MPDWATNVYKELLSRGLLDSFSNLDVVIPMALRDAKAEGIAEERARLRNPWQPISTAPRDGTAILVFGLWAGEINGIDEIADTFIVSWEGGHTDYQFNRGPLVPTGFDWMVHGGDAYAAWAKPTHWMPIPTLPKE